MSRVQRFACTAFVAMGAIAYAGVSQAQTAGPSRALNVYGGISYGLQVTTGCGGTATCDSGRDAVKLFGGYRMTPNLATEVSYYYLGTQSRSWAGGQKPAYIGAGVNTRIDSQEDKTQVLGLGVNLETELFSWMTNHLRVGLAVSHTKSDLTLANGTKKEETQDRYFPYAGVGASALISPSVRLVSGIDVLLNPDRTYYVITAGIAGEF